MHSWTGWSCVWVLMGMSVWNATPPSHIKTMKLVSYWERNHFSFNECLLFCCPEMIILCRDPAEMKKGSTLGTFWGPRPSTLSSRVQMIMISDNMRCSLHKSIDEEELIQGRRLLWDDRSMAIGIVFIHVSRKLSTPCWRWKVFNSKGQQSPLSGVWGNGQQSMATIVSFLNDDDDDRVLELGGKESRRLRCDHWCVLHQRSRSRCPLLKRYGYFFFLAVVDVDDRQFAAWLFP